MAYGSASQAESAMRKRIGGSNPPLSADPLRTSEGSVHFRRTVQRRSHSLESLNMSIARSAGTLTSPSRLSSDGFGRSASCRTIFRLSTRAVLDGKPSHSTPEPAARHNCRCTDSVLRSFRPVGSPSVLDSAALPDCRRALCDGIRAPLRDNRRRERLSHRGSLSEALLESRCAGYDRYGWGYPFDWEGITGTIKSGTPLITTLPYVYEAFGAVEAIDAQSRWRDVRRSIAQHALLDYRDIPVSDRASSCGYTPAPDDSGMVVNASAYRAFLLTRAAVDFGDESYHQAAVRNLRFVLESQRADGSWSYSTDGKRPFVDHFHTCFVLKALAKIERIDPSADVTDALSRGVMYYARHLFDKDRLPRPFSKAPRLTVYRRELYRLRRVPEPVHLAARSFRGV